MDFFRQFILLFWKNWLLQSREICVTVFEILVPAIFAAIILVTRTSGSVSGMTSTIVYNRLLVDGIICDSVSDSFSDGTISLPDSKTILYTPDIPSIRVLMNKAMEKVNLDSNQSISDGNPSHPKGQTDGLILHNLSKFYGNQLAVKKLCLGVPQNECFGLLGVNGGGKTSTFKLLTGEENVCKSGGTKRKLSTAVVLIGDPPVIFLDEPTTGVDPVPRQQLWNLFSGTRASGRTLILTSHRMEQCDALCTLLVIMVNGQFLCLGSSQHLKNKFGQGYTFIARVESSHSEELEHFIEHKFLSHYKMDSCTGYVSYQLTDPSLPLSYLFGTVEKFIGQHHLEDYSVGQTTVYQMFLNFTINQIVSGKQAKKNCCCTCCCCCCRSK